MNALYMEAVPYKIAEESIDIDIAFEQLFKTHFKELHGYAISILQEVEMAEEMVQNVFCRLWEKKDTLSINQSSKAYLYRSVHNECLNYLKHLKVKEKHIQFATQNTSHSSNASDSIQYKELTNKLQETLNDLPEQCRTIFQMSRFEELKYREIAAQLGLSVKTIENQMGKALKILRNNLIDFLPAIIISLLNL